MKFDSCTLVSSNHSCLRINIQDSIKNMDTKPFTQSCMHNATICLHTSYCRGNAKWKKVDTACVSIGNDGRIPMCLIAKPICSALSFKVPENDHILMIGNMQHQQRITNMQTRKLLEIFFLLSTRHRAWLLAKVFTASWFAQSVAKAADCW